MADIKTDNGNNLWIDKGGNNYVLVLGKYFLNKHGEGKQVAGGTIKGWKTVKDIYDFYKNVNFSLRPGFQTIKVKPGENVDTVAELSASEVAKLKPEDLGIADKNNFDLPNLPPNKAPILRKGHPKGKSTPAGEFQMLMFPTSYEELEKDPDMKDPIMGSTKEAISKARELETDNNKLWIILTTYPGKQAAPGNREGKEKWLHPEKGKIVGNLAFTEDSVNKVEPWPQPKEASDWVGFFLN